MRRLATMTLTCLLLAGCAGLKLPGITDGSPDTARSKLAAASAALSRGKTQDAVALLKDVCAHSAIDGVTDEALFRLAVLRLAETDEHGGRGEARRLMSQLKKGYPHSQWTTLARPLMETLAEMEKLEGDNLRLTNSAKYRELQNIKGLNQSLIKQNRDLQQTINRLKELDLELERKGH